MPEDDTGPQITIIPDPPVKGQKLKIYYSGNLPAELTITWVPAGQPTSVTMPSPSGCTEITVPDDASSMNIHDPSGSAPDLSRVVT